MYRGCVSTVHQFMDWQWQQCVCYLLVYEQGHTNYTIALRCSLKQTVNIFENCVLQKTGKNSIVHCIVCSIQPLVWPLPLITPIHRLDTVTSYAIDVIQTLHSVQSLQIYFTRCICLFSPTANLLKAHSVNHFEIMPQRPKKNP